MVEYLFLLIHFFLMWFILIPLIFMSVYISKFGDGLFTQNKLAIINIVVGVLLILLQVYFYTKGKNKLAKNKYLKKIYSNCFNKIFITEFKAVSNDFYKELSDYEKNLINKDLVSLRKGKDTIDIKRL